MVKGSSNRDGERRVGKYLAHGLKIRRASFTVRCISTNSVYEGDETEEKGWDIFLNISITLPAFLFLLLFGRGEITPASGIARGKSAHLQTPTPMDQTVAAISSLSLYEYR